VLLKDERPGQEAMVTSSSRYKGSLVDLMVSLSRPLANSFLTRFLTSFTMVNTTADAFPNRGPNDSTVSDPAAIPESAGGDVYVSDAFELLSFTVPQFFLHSLTVLLWISTAIVLIPWRDPLGETL
jgi:hypothetical protein